MKHEKIIATLDTGDQVQVFCSSPGYGREAAKAAIVHGVEKDYYDEDNKHIKTIFYPPHRIVDVSIYMVYSKDL